MNSDLTVWVTRAEPGAGATGARLSALGFQPLIAPLLTVAAMDTPFSLDGVGALAVTSANGVRAFAARIERRDVPVFAVGDATARAARTAGFQTVTSADGDGDALVRLILDAPPQGVVLCPGPRQRAGDVPGALERAGIAARPVPLYETIAATELAQPVRKALIEGAVGAVLIHSARGGEALARLAAPFDLSQTAVVGLSLACLQPLAGFELGTSVTAAAPRESALLDALLSTASDLAPRALGKPPGAR